MIVIRLSRNGKQSKTSGGASGEPKVAQSGLTAQCFSFIYSSIKLEYNSTIMNMQVRTYMKQ